MKSHDRPLNSVVQSLSRLSASTARHLSGGIIGIMATRLERYRWRGQDRDDTVLALRIDTGDYDEMCWIVGWADAQAVDVGDAVIALDTADGETMYGRDGDWMVQLDSGAFVLCDSELFAGTFLAAD